jgi:hypothetical protein
MAVPTNFNPAAPFGGAQPSEPQTAYEFQTVPRSTIMPAHMAFPPEPLPHHLVAGVRSPILPHQALVLFNAPELNDLPPASSLYTRPFTTLTSG